MPAYIVGEISANHNQDFQQAVRLIGELKAAGADAVKLQTYTPDTMTIACDRAEFRIGGGTLWDGDTLHKLYARAYTPWEWVPKLNQVAAEQGLQLFSTAFDSSAVDFLEKLDLPAIKIASFEIVDVPLIARAARSGKALILSVGMATVGEIEEAVQTARSSGATQIALLKCTSAYPAPYDGMNLRTIPHLAGMFRLPVGLSDHTLGIAVPVAAVALGASIVEKHVALSRADGSPDAAFSLEPAEFRAMVEAVRAAEQALGEVRYDPTAAETASRVFRRSLFVVKDVRAGEVFTPENVRSIRPGHGLHPRYLGEILGRYACTDLAAGTPLRWQHVRCGAS